LLALAYESSPGDLFTDVFKFPRAAGQPPPPDRTIEFNSPIADLRLRRHTEQKQSESTANDEKIAGRVEELLAILKSSEVNLDSVFLPPKASRPEKPRYIEIAEAELARGSQKRKYQPMDMAQITREYSKRCDEAGRRGVKRAKQRQARFAAYARNNENDRGASQNASFRDD
jgi:hypothetical protein